MTEKQAERLRLKIKRIKAALAADKKRWGGYYDDSRGLRYLPPQYYIKLGDYAGGGRYFNWFNKNFPDDAGFPDFLFEWIIILFMTKKLKEAEKKAFEAYCRNTYIFDKFFGRPIIPIDKSELSNLEVPGFVDYFNYSFKQSELHEFGIWLDQFIKTPKFVMASRKFIELNQQLKNEYDIEKRRYLIDQTSQLLEQF